MYILIIYFMHIRSRSWTRSSLNYVVQLYSNLKQHKLIYISSMSWPKSQGFRPLSVSIHGIFVISYSKRRRASYFGWCKDEILLTSLWSFSRFPGINVVYILLMEQWFLCFNPLGSSASDLRCDTSLISYALCTLNCYENFNHHSVFG